MDPLVSTYVSSLNQHGAKGPPPVGWRCPICQLPSLQRSEESYLRHAEQLHADEFEEKRKELGPKFEAWKEELKTQAFSVVSRPPAALGHSADRKSPDSSAAAVQSLGSAQELGMSRLSLHSQRELRPMESPPQPSPRTQCLKRPAEQPASQPPHPLSHGLAQTRVASQNKPPRHRRSSPPKRKSPPITMPSQNRNASREHSDAADSPRASKRQLTGHAQPQAQRTVIEMSIDPRYPEMLSQPDSRAITQEQLAAEVKSIYSGLTMIESKCIHVNKVRTAAVNDPKNANIQIPGDHWKALISLHRTLLHEHHDFFLASQHPSASLALRRLAAKYNMPARMWKHGIHSFLELLRRHLPDSLEYMISFIYLAYQMMSLLYETVPSFEDTWIECLGDLSRYRMAVEEEDVRDRETWASVARFWYSKAADRIPNIGRLYHHLAILARPNALQQLYLYSRSLICLHAFLSARDSIQTLLGPIRKDSYSSHISRIDYTIIKIHALFFNHETDGLNDLIKNFYSELPDQIARFTAKWRELGVYIGFSHISLLFDCGSQTAKCRRLFDIGNLYVLGQELNPDQMQQLDRLRNHQPSDTSTQLFERACNLTFKTLTLILKRSTDKNVHPYMHIILCFLLSLAKFQRYDLSLPTELLYVSEYIFQSVSWADLAEWLNDTLSTVEDKGRFESESFLKPEAGEIGPLPEDHLIRGAVFTQAYFPDNWFKHCESDDEERSIEHASTVKMRADRVLWLGYQLALSCKELDFDSTRKRWSATRHVPKIAVPDEDGDEAMPDVDSARTSDSGDESEEDSDEVKAIRKIDRQYRRNSAVEKIDHSPKYLGPPSPNRAKRQAMKDMVQDDFTVLVCGKEVLLEIETFDQLVKSTWSLVVPQSELLQLSAMSADSSAEEAVQRVEEAIAKFKTVRVLDSDGEDVTGQAMSRLSQQPPGTGKGNSNEDILIGIARTASDLDKLGVKPSSNSIRPAVLVTDNRTTRVKAKRRGVPALDLRSIKDFILGSRSRASSFGSNNGSNIPLQRVIQTS